MSRVGLMATLGLADRRHFATTYLRSSLDTGVIEMTLPQSPRSRNQRNRLTTLGRLGILTRERGADQGTMGGSQGYRELRDRSGFAATAGRTKAICKAGLARKAPNSGVMPVK